MNQGFHSCTSSTYSSLGMSLTGETKKLWPIWCSISRRRAAASE